MGGGKEEATAPALADFQGSHYTPSLLGTHPEELGPPAPPSSLFPVPVRSGCASTQHALTLRRHPLLPTPRLLSLSPSSSSPLRVEASPWALVPPLPRPAAYSNLSLRLRSRLRSLWAIQVLDPAPEFRPRPSFGVSGGYGGGNRPTGPGLVSESGQEVSAEPGVQGRPWDPGVHRPSPPVGAALSSLVRVLSFPGRA